MRNKYNFNVRQYVSDLPKHGRISFSIDELKKQCPEIPQGTLARTLTRLVTAGLIQSVHKGFYTVVPVEYALKGIVPPVLYINQLMTYLNRKYYIGLLDAAAFYVSAHHRPQEFTVIIALPPMRCKEKKGIKINFMHKAKISDDLIVQMKTKTGFVNVSSPELTAIDLVSFQTEIGGINRVCEVLYDLCEEMNFENLQAAFIKTLPKTIIQRLGYILDVILVQDKLAGLLYNKAQKAGIVFRKTVLNTAKPMGEFKHNKKWEIIVNEKIEIDI